MSKINLVNAHIFKLDPDAKYIVALDNTAVTMEDAHQLLESLGRMGIKNTVAMVTKSSPDKAIKIIEQKEQTDGSGK